MSDDKRDPMLETDVADGSIVEHTVGRIRREFMCQAAIAMLASPETSSERAAWYDAEALLLEGQRRGVLP